MKIRTAFVLAALMLSTLVLPALAEDPEVIQFQSIYHDKSGPLRDIAITKTATVGEKREVPIRRKPFLGGTPGKAAPDGGLQTFLKSLKANAPTPTPSLSVPGLSELDNIAVLNTAIVPPDTNGDIGLDDLGNKVYFQYINLIWGVFDATTGAPIGGPFAGNSFWVSFGGFCESNNDGDPVVLYDDQAGRWLASQFSVNQGIQCLALSTTSDPLGTYDRWAFTVTPGGANDYPKLGVWDDGTTGSSGQSAYTFTLRDFGGAGGPFSVSAGVFDRDAMLAGSTAVSGIKFINPCVTNDCIEGQLPPHLAGPPPAAGTCPTYWTAVDGDFDDVAPFSNDGYRNHTLCVDWSNLNNSTYTEGPLVVAGSNFDRTVGGISPVLNGEALDSLASFTMYRAQYRWFGNNARVVLNTTVDAGGDRAGIRWAETRSADGDSGWFLQQDGTYAPADGNERWMGSIAQDGDGNIALGYSVAGANLFPAVRYASRMGGDTLGTLPGGEVSCHEGTGAQIASFGRWGDYSSMSVDPEDDCTFWYTQEYYDTTTDFDWKTRICSFAFPGCGSGCTPNQTPEASCSDGQDNDCDGDFDCADADCAADAACACQASAEVCDNGSDDDCDGLTDCDDADCAGDVACVPPPVPENDECTDAIEVVCPAGGGTVTVSGSTDSATFDGAPFCGTSNTAPGIWYRVTHSGLVTASVCNAANYDSKISVYDGGCGVLGCVTGIDDSPGCGLTSEVSWVGDGSEDLVLIHGFGGATGDFDLTITCAELIDGDVCEDAGGPLEVDSITSGSTSDATLDEPPDIDCGTPVTAPGVWYTVTGTGNTMTASTCIGGGGADYDTRISVYCADCEVKECIGGNDDDFPNCGFDFTSTVSWPTTAGKTYNVLVHGFSSQTGDFDLAILDDGVPAEGANDCDGVDDGIDLCLGTDLPEAVPTSGSLSSNNSALTDTSGVFETALPNPQGLLFTTADTAGCSCEQIVEAQHLGNGHLQNGCSPGAMMNWVDFLQEQSCGNCVESHGGIGCDNAECEAAICAIDPFCCNVAWDGLCVLEALDICVPDLCIALPSSLAAPLTFAEGRAPVVPAEPTSKEP